MSSLQIHCGTERRRDLVRTSAPAGISGIDYVEITVGASVADPVFIDIFLVRPLPLPAAALTADNIRLTGGTRFVSPAIDPVVGHVPGGVEVSRYRLTLPPFQLTDFSTYHLALVASGSDGPPAFIDHRLSAVDLSFKITCPTDFDCAPVCISAPDPLPPEPVFDYRTRDYPGFRRLMLDRMATLVPGFREDDPVDLTTTLIEALAYRADQQSYRLDWVGTEAFLSTARARTSVTRHARLVDYVPAEGASARVFAQFTFTPAGGVADGMILAAATPLLTGTAGLSPVVAVTAYKTQLARAPMVFETAGPLTLWAWRNRIALHTWSDEACCLPKGTTSTTLVDASSGIGGLAPGDFLALVEVASPLTGAAADARPDRRHVVRLTRVTPTTDVLAPGLALVDVEWAAADALPFDLVIDATPRDATGPAARVICTIAQSNIMLADHGATLPPSPHLGLTPTEIAVLRPRLDPALPPVGENWRPRVMLPLAMTGAQTRAGFDLARIAPPALADIPARTAADLCVVKGADCLPAFALLDSFSTWTARRDLLASAQFTRDFVIEIGIDSTPTLRFGDGVNGLAPATGGSFAATGRFGCGRDGNIGQGALGHVVLPAAQQGAIITVTNPLPAGGGAAPEPLTSIRIAAPQAFRLQDRAVTAADYAEVAMRHPQVANATAVARWTGAWQTMLVTIDRIGGLAVDASFVALMLRHIEHFRLAGFDVAVRGARAAPLDIALFVCADPAELRSTVDIRVRAMLMPFGPADGAYGFFHPDNFTFGTPLYLSRLIAAVMAVPGVQTVSATLFQRYGRLPQDELAAGMIRPTGTEILQLDNDPSFPERGRLAIRMGGGR